ncbi:unnamed protein product [Prorocentrum cordatum]|uniref:Receptor for retinol uptake STRA6 n=1 Tax=Prorocentrum cordatum TaxID=2364126 RepID=A0ABN9XVP0_9DINO|nr:unnamed protein product [Polarella glacialis]
MATGQEPADLPASGARTEAGAPAAKHRGAGEHGEPRFGFAGYAAMLTAAGGVWLADLWSSMFIDAGESHPYALLRENYWLSNVFLSVGLLLGITLYVLDVFMPPHLRGQPGALWNNDRCVGRALLVLVVLLFLVGCLFMAAYYPHFPMLIFIALGMVIPASVRLLTLPQRADGAGRGARELGRRESKLSSLKALVQKSDDALKFYQAFAFAYFSSSVAVAFAWAVQVGSGQICFSGCDNQFTVVSDSCGDSAADGLDSGLVVFLAMSPLFVAFANLVFGLFALVRIVMNSTYLSTSRHRNQLATALRVNREALERNEVLLELSPAPSENAEPRPSGGSEPTREVSEEFQSMELKSYQQLTMLVKAVGFMLILLIGLSYAGALLVWADNEIASMFCSLLVVFFIGFILMTVFSFSRIAHVLGNWLIDLPLWGHVLNFMKNDWVQAFTLCIVFPLLLPFAVLCITNQRVRSLRGISGFVDQDAVDSAALSTVDPDDPAVPAADPIGMRAFLNELNHLLHPTDTQPDSPLRFWVTARVHGVWQKIRNLRWLSIQFTFGVCCPSLTTSDPWSSTRGLRT